MKSVKLGSFTVEGGTAGKKTYPDSIDSLAGLQDSIVKHAGESGDGTVDVMGILANDETLGAIYIDFQGVLNSTINAGMPQGITNDNNNHTSSE